jgi:alkanesulfonate monooxygenase SsuD/methylene tetrahydromethanopterin reductase-like flavin-dependent oxidoreductase (luciferase family)
MFGLRFDLRNPSFAHTSPRDRVRAAVEMAAWADQRGAVTVALSEHHGSEDGYLPSPLVVAAAIASRTRTVRIMLAALIVPLYDPLRLAEDLSVLDALSEGRIDVVLGGGYVGEEFEMFGVPLAERPARVEEAVAVLRAAWAGEPFEFRGRTVRVTPRPHRPGGPPLLIGGSSPAAARRAARIGDGYVPVSDDSWPAYRAEMQRLGKADPGPRLTGPAVTTVVAADPEAAWDALLPYFLHETNAYGAWLEAAGVPGPYRSATADEVRNGGQYRIIGPEECAEELKGFLMLQPMVGGIPPDRAWASLEVVDSVLGR